jgi:hypothetical protein
MAFLTTVGARAAAAGAAEASPGDVASDPGGVLELAALAGVGGPVGPMGVAVSLMPLRRLSVGVAMGQLLVGNTSEAPRAFRAALVLRFYPIELPRLRVAIGAWASDGAGGDDWSGGIMTAPNGASLNDQWSWSHGRRLDGTIAVEGGARKRDLASRGRGGAVGSPDPLRRLREVWQVRAGGLSARPQ